MNSKEAEDGLGWFINEDDRLHKGSDFACKEDDTFRLIKHLRHHYGKGDLFRYLTAENRDFQMAPKK